METLLFLLFFIVGSLSALGGVAIGAYAVFKTKRDPYEPFFGGPGKGDSFNIDDGFGDGETIENPKLPKSTKEANGNFIDQFAKNLVDKVVKK